MRHQDRNQHGRRYKKVGWDRLVRPRMEVAVMEAGMALGLAGGRESLVAGMEVVAVDMELGSVPESGLRNLVEEGIDFDSHPVVVRSSAREDIAVEAGIVLEGDTAAARKELVGGAEAGLRNSRCLT